jgi:hypothetical protein
MTTKEICTLFENLAEISTLFLTISGGEIFLRKDFFDAMRAFGGWSDVASTRCRGCHRRQIRVRLSYHGN